MRILGLDPSSTYGGAALVDTPDIVRIVDHWERDKKRSHPQGFLDYHEWLVARLVMWKPHMAVIEFIAYSGAKTNAQAIQAVAFYQAISALTCKMRGVVVLESRASSARRTVLGRGNLSKDDTWELMRKRYPNLFSPKTRGGLDEMDALVLALSGETAAER